MARRGDVEALGARRCGTGISRLSSDLVIIEGAVMPTGVAVVSSSVSDGMEDDFQAGHIGLTWPPPTFRL